MWLSQVNFVFCQKAVVQREGNKLKASLKGIESVTELVDGNTIINVSRCVLCNFNKFSDKLSETTFSSLQTMTLGGIVYKRISKRV